MKVLTANRLADGEAVWYAAGLGWLETIHGADVASGAAAEEALAAAGKAAFSSNEVVDVELIDVAQADGQIVPNRLRERIRAAGPSTRIDLGKQARGLSADAA